MITKTLTADEMRTRFLTAVCDDDTQVRALGASEVADVEWLSRHRSFGDGDDHLFSVPPERYCDPVAWVAETQSRISGFAFGWECSGNIAHIRAGVHSQFRHLGIDQRLARAALESAREHGCLKVVLHNAPSAMWAIQIVEESGFIFSRRRESNGETRLEFYLDLYARPAALSGEEP